MKLKRYEIASIVNLYKLEINKAYLDGLHDFIQSRSKTPVPEITEAMVADIFNKEENFEDVEIEFVYINGEISARSLKEIIYDCISEDIWECYVECTDSCCEEWKDYIED